MKTYWLLPILIFGLAWAYLPAQNPARTGADHALFFVVKDFDHWQDFSEKSVRQVREIEAELKDNYGFTTEFVLNPTKQQVIGKLDAYAKRQFKSKDQLLVYFSMHGHYEEGRIGALIPKDGRLKDVAFQTWIIHPVLEDMVSRIGCEHITLALDACYSGTFAGGRGKPAVDASKVGDDCLAKSENALRYKSRLYLTSGGKERTSIDSHFAEKWVEALRQRNVDGVLSHNDLVGILEDANPIPRYGEFKGHKKQGNFVFVHRYLCVNEEPSYITDQRADKEAWLQAEKTHTLSAYRSYLARFLRGDFRLLAEQQVARLEAEQREANDWRQAKTQNTADAYKVFVRSHPNSVYRKVAETMLKKLGEPPITDDLPNFVFVKGGSFRMGREDGDSDEKPVHPVTINDFYIGIHEVTFEEYDAYCTATGTTKPDDYSWGRGKLPVINVSWEDAVAFANWRSGQDGLQKVYTIGGETVSADWDANGYRLPTEAEWEFAARSRGKDEKWAGTSTESSLALYGNYYEDGKEGKDGYKNTAPVGSFRANSLGLYDMSGNVWEWCWDWKGTYPSSSQTNPKGPKTGSYRVFRGCSWLNSPGNLRCTNRHDYNPDDRNNFIGFRLARAAP